MRLPSLRVEDLIGIINSSDDLVIAFDTDEKTFETVTRESLADRELGYVLVLDADGIGAVNDLYGMTDRQLARELEVTVEELNDALIDPGRRAQQFPELDEALNEQETE